MAWEGVSDEKLYEQIQEFRQQLNEAILEEPTNFLGHFVRNATVKALDKTLRSLEDEYLRRQRGS